MVDNTLAMQIKPFDLGNSLATAARVNQANQETQASQFKLQQQEMGSEARGLTPFVNTPEFPQRWAESIDRLASKGMINPQMADQMRKNPSPLMLKSIISQTEDPALSFRKEEAVREQKNTNFTQGLQLRAANRADDPTPAGFDANPAFKADPTQPKYIPQSGGPKDPAYIAKVARDTAIAEGDAPKVVGSGSAIVVPNKAADGPLYRNAPSVSTLDDSTLTAMADQYLAGDRTVFQNLGRGAQGAENVVRLRQEVTRRAQEAGVDPKGIVSNFNEQAGALAGQRAVGTRAANISLAANEANNMIQIALDASDKVPRTIWMPINKAIQKYQAGSSSPELASFVAATNSLVNAYVRAVSPSGVPTDSMRQHAYDMLNSAQGPEAYKAVVSTMRMEMNAALAAPSQVRKELRRDGQSDVVNDPSQGNLTGPRTTKSGVKWSVQ